MIKVNIDKAKDMVHDLRRSARAEEFKPYDEIIMKQIPTMDLTEVEQERQKIRDKYSELQDNINNVESLEELKELKDLLDS
jgi:hypothetical protein